MADRGRLSELRTQLAKAEPDWALAGRLLRSALDEGDFRAFCDLVPIHTRKAYDLIAISRAVDTDLLDPDAITKIGWSKSRLVAAHAQTKRDASRAVTFARKNTLPALAAFLRGEPDLGGLVTKCFHLSQKEARAVEMALRKAGARSRGGRLQNRSESLMVIIRTYQKMSTARR